MLLPLVVAWSTHTYFWPHSLGSPHCHQSDFFQNTYVVWETDTEKLSCLPEATQKAVAQTGRQEIGL